MIPLKIGRVAVEIHHGWTRTVFPDGKELHAHHAPQPGQELTARDLGMSVAEMNRTHDLAHTLVAHWLGLPYSGSLYKAAACLSPSPEDYVEETVVMALQAFAKARGVDLVMIARRITAAHED